MEKLFKKMMDQVDDLMIAMKSGDDTKIKAEYAKLTRVRKAARALTKPVVVPPSKPKKIDWDNFDKMMNYERSEITKH